MMGTGCSLLLWVLLPCFSQVACMIDVLDCVPCPQSPLCHELLLARTVPSSLHPSWHPPVLV